MAVSKQKIQNCLSLKKLAEACQEIWEDYDTEKGYTEQQCMEPMAKLAYDMLVLGGYFDAEASEAKESVTLGTIFPKLQESSLLMKYLKNGYNVVPQLTLSMEEPFHLYLKGDAEGRLEGEKLLQHMLYRSIEGFPKGAFRWICVDVWKGGRSFGPLGRVAWSDEALFGKGIYTGERELTDALTELENRTKEILEKLAGGWDSVYAYNQEHKKPIPLTLAVFCDVSQGKGYDVEKRLKWIQENSSVTGIHLIFLEDAGTPDLEVLGHENMLCLEFSKKDCAIRLEENTLSLGFQGAAVTEREADLLLSKLGEVHKVDTSIESHTTDNTKYFTMDSTEMLRIPFAFDEEENLCYLELGGKAPAHALLSGTTGSGKSVTLHTIIDQILMNYHPDDVEIWAIDYKAVEFGCYAVKKTPHIRVIGQDNSMDFSISLLNLISKEYEKRKELFVNEGVRDFEGYRASHGSRSLPRIFIMIDEFHNLTQAVQNYRGERNYKTLLENLLRETRAMGISFFFCSQTIAAGLEGLSEAGRSQIGCRLCMLQEDTREIQETLALPAGTDFDTRVITQLATGEIYYKKPNRSVGEGGYRINKYHVLYISDEKRSQLIDEVNEVLGNDYRKKEDIISRGSGRYRVSEKPLHTLTRFVNGENVGKSGSLVYFFGAPKTLEHEFRAELEDDAGSNVLLVGSDDELRESILIHMIMGLLMDSGNQIYVSLLEKENEAQSRLCEQLQRIHTSRIHIARGAGQVLDVIESVKKIRPLGNERRIYFWYGLNKLKNAIFLLSQEEADTIGPTAEPEPLAYSAPEEEEDPLKALDALLNEMNGENRASGPVQKEPSGEKPDFAACQKILADLAEYGPENGYYNVSVYHQVKAWKKGGIEKLSEYEHRIGLRMSADDSYELFGSSGFADEVDGKSAVYFNGGKRGRMILPYLLPGEQWMEQYNRRLESLEAGRSGSL